MRETNFEPFIKGFVTASVLCALVFCGPVGNTTQPPEPESDACEPAVFSGPIAAVDDTQAIPVLPDIPEDPVEDPNPYADLEITDTEKELLACMAYSEARGEPFEGQVAVVQVALNRYIYDTQEFGESISEVLLTPRQFSVGKTYEEQQMEAVEAALAGEPSLDLNTDVVFFSTGSLTCGSYYKTIGGHVFRTYT